MNNTIISLQNTPETSSLGNTEILDQPLYTSADFSIRIANLQPDTAAIKTAESLIKAHEDSNPGLTLPLPRYDVLTNYIPIPGVRKELTNVHLGTRDLGFGAPLSIHERSAYSGLVKSLDQYKAEPSEKNLNNLQNAITQFRIYSNTNSP